jgi:catechol 2,3-dioxygenase-like lactoylglutathione lyase family enzyme
MNIQAIDHIVITVKNIDRTCRFYESVLGMIRKTENNRTSLHCNNQKINVHEVGTIIDTKVLHATPGSADICLITDSSIENILRHLESKKITIIEGPCNRLGANGTIASVYFYDPDENLLEVSTYTNQ